MTGPSLQTNARTRVVYALYELVAKLPRASYDSSGFPVDHKSPCLVDLNPSNYQNCCSGNYNTLGELYLLWSRTLLVIQWQLP